MPTALHGEAFQAFIAPSEGALQWSKACPSKVPGQRSKRPRSARPPYRARPQRRSPWDVVEWFDHQSSGPADQVGGTALLLGRVAKIDGAPWAESRPTVGPATVSPATVSRATASPAVGPVMACAVQVRRERLI
jgi:hypothetical protein